MVRSVPSRADVTALLRAWRAGDERAGEAVLELLALDRVLATFAPTYPRQARVVEMRYFADLEVEEIAACLDVDWQSWSPPDRPALIARQLVAVALWIGQIR
jgi:DNA-directed RNA polymerase specialized sigma24 family protein